MQSYFKRHTSTSPTISISVTHSKLNRVVNYLCLFNNIPVAECISENAYISFIWRP